MRYLVQHDIQLGVRLREGPVKGPLEWRRPNRMTLPNMLKHPLSAGAYASGRLCSAFIISLRRARDSRLHRQGCMSYTALDISPLSRDNMERDNED